MLGVTSPLAGGFLTFRRVTAAEDAVRTTEGVLLVGVKGAPVGGAAFVALLGFLS